MPPPVPPRVKAGRMMSGKRPIFSATGAGFLQVVGVPLTGTSRPMESIRSLNTWRSSPRSMASGLAPIISTPYLSSVPRRIQGHGGVEGGLAAERGQQDELARPADALHLLDFAGDDFLDALGRDRLDVGAVGELRVGHDGGRVGVDQDDAVAFFPEGFAGLRAGIIELARLADDDRAGADDQDRMDVGALRHKGRRNKADSGAVVSSKFAGVSPRRWIKASPQGFAAMRYNRCAVAR